MPNATVDVNSFERKELRSLEGAYIMVRPLPFGKKLERRDKATKMFMESEGDSTKGNKGAANANKNRLELEMMSKWSTMYDFAYCIGEHNLEDVGGRTLNLSSKMDFEMLDPRVGGEIEQILDSINNEDEDLDEELFTPSLSSVTEDHQE